MMADIQENMMKGLSGKILSGDNKITRKIRPMASTVNLMSKLGRIG